MKRTRSHRTMHPLCMNSSRHWLRILRLYGGVDWHCLDRALAISLLSPLTIPVRLAERYRYARRVERTEIQAPPVFILGHWRTGTTYLHNLMCQDPAMGYVSLFQTLAPASCLVGRTALRPLLAMRAPKTRPMDNVQIEMDQAQEEEFAMSHVCGESFYLGWYFPRKMPSLFRKYVLSEGLSDAETMRWQRNYLSLLNKATLCSGGRRLVVKNPVNTARIPQLLRLFPDAKFIHIYRDPYTVFKSTLRMHRTVLDLVALQYVDDAQIEQNVLHFYPQMIERYLAEKDAIPSGNIVELCYEDLEARPLRQIERIYHELDLPGWEHARAPIERFAASQQRYKKNRFAITRSDIQKVENHWSVALETWGYARPDRRAPQRESAPVSLN